MAPPLRSIFGFVLAVMSAGCAAHAPSIGSVASGAGVKASAPGGGDGESEFAAATARAFEAPAAGAAPEAGRAVAADACLVMLDTSSGRTRVMNSARAIQRFSPCSTFKIPNALIGLDTGVIPEADAVIAWDGETRARAITNRDHSLRTAISYSVAWYFQELARRVGETRMQRDVDAFDYGNRDLSAGLTQFWLGTSLRISAIEQVAFLRKLQDGTLPVQPRSAAIVQECLILADGPGWTFRGKTGSHEEENHDDDLGWFVGWVERDGRVTIFAANESGAGAFGPVVRAKVERVLVELDQLPPDWETHRRKTPLP